MKWVPDLSRDMILQKAMVNTMTFLTEFRLAFACGDQPLAKTKAKDLFSRCTDMIDQYLEYSILSKPYEIDPFMKAAWIVKESQSLFPDNEFKPMVSKASELLHIVMGKRGQAKGSFEQAKILNEELIGIKLHNDWID